MMLAWHHSDSGSTLHPLPKSSITWFGGIFSRLPLAAGILCCDLSHCSVINMQFRLTKSFAIATKCIFLVTSICNTYFVNIYILITN